MSTLAGLGFAAERTAVLLHQLQRGGQAQAGALPDRLGRVEGIKNAQAGIVVHATTIVAHVDQSLVILLLQPHLDQLALSPGRAARVFGVDQQITEDLLQLIGVGLDHNRRSRRQLYLDAGQLQGVGHQL